MKKEEESNLRMKICAVLCLFVLVAISVGYLIIRFRFIRKEEKFPFIWTFSMNRTIQNYVSKYPSREVLYVTGPYKSGKSRAMKIIQNQLISQGRLVVSVDANNFWPIGSFLSAIKGSIAQSLVEIKPKIPADVLRNLQERRQKFIRNRKVNESIPENIDPSLHGVYSSLSNVVDKIFDGKEVSAFAVTKFFNRLEFYREQLRPVLIIHNYDRLLSSNVSAALFDAIESRLSRRNLYGDFVPVICEVADTSIFARQKLDSIPSITATAETVPFTKKESEFLIENKYLRRSEFKKLYNAFGGHGGHFAECYEDLLYGEGESIESIIKRRTNELDNKLANIMNDAAKNAVRKVCRGKAGVNSIDDLEPLLRRGYITLDRNLTFHFGSKVVEKILC